MEKRISVQVPAVVSIAENAMHNGVKIFMSSLLKTLQFYDKIFILLLH